MAVDGRVFRQGDYPWLVAWVLVPLVVAGIFFGLLWSDFARPAVGEAGSPPAWTALFR